MCRHFLYVSQVLATFNFLNAECLFSFDFFKAWVEVLLG